MPRLRHGVVSRHGDALGANHPPHFQAVTETEDENRWRRSGMYFTEVDARWRDGSFANVCVCVCVCSSAVVAAVCVSTVCEFAHLKPFSSFFDVLKETRYPCRHRSSSDPGKTKSTHLHATDHHLTTALALPAAVCHHGPYMDRRLLDSVSD